MAPAAGAEDGVSIDAAIAKPAGKEGFGRTRKLEAWKPAADDVPAGGVVDGGLECSSSQAWNNNSSSHGQWDQFAANKARFGVETSWDEGLYTTRLDKRNAKISEQDAARIAAEIEAESSSNRHLAEERRHWPLPSHGGADEEDLYSAVARGPNAAGPWRVAGKGGRKSSASGGPAPTVPNAWNRAGAMPATPESPGLGSQSEASPTVPIGVDHRKEVNRLRSYLNNPQARPKDWSSPYGTPKNSFLLSHMPRSPIADSPLVSNSTAVDALNLNPGMPRIDEKALREFHRIKGEQMEAVSRAQAAERLERMRTFRKQQQGGPQAGSSAASTSEGVLSPSAILSPASAGALPLDSGGYVLDSHGPNGGSPTPRSSLTAALKGSSPVQTPNPTFQVQTAAERGVTGSGAVPPPGRTTVGFSVEAPGFVPAAQKVQQSQGSTSAAAPRPAAGPQAPSAASTTGPSIMGSGKTMGSPGSGSGMSRAPSGGPGMGGPPNSPFGMQRAPSGGSGVGGHMGRTASHLSANMTGRTHPPHNGPPLTSPGSQRGRPQHKAPLSPQNRHSSRSSSRPPEPPAWYPGEGQPFSPPQGGPMQMGPMPMQGPQMGFGWVPGNGMPPPQQGYSMMPGQPPMMFMGPRGPFTPAPGQAYMMPGYGLVMPHPMQVAMAQGRGAPMFQPTMMGPVGLMPQGPVFDMPGMSPGQQGPFHPPHQGPPRGPPQGPFPDGNSPTRGPKGGNVGGPTGSPSPRRWEGPQQPEQAGQSG
ncbi:hypothetical protein WJX84_002721 [Apatococcus fuscideae]|uniref:LsmAD domain-containing protein n=1 Tax=Apatococcus fuscideae TaxID=2026836 RepID=A0AAW1SYB6_9CHLO